MQRYHQRLTIVSVQVQAGRPLPASDNVSGIMGTCAADAELPGPQIHSKATTCTQALRSEQRIVACCPVGRLMLLLWRLAQAPRMIAPSFLAQNLLLFKLETTV
jgi:hypothetical protein